jgi:hypothetical protein
MSVNSTGTVELLVENLDVRQRENEGWRRWFVNSYFELIVWYQSPSGPLTGFQLCLSRNRWERAFTWTSEYASSHFVSDAFIEDGFSKMSTGILRGDGNRISEPELERFERESASLDPDLRNLILAKIHEYNARRG